MRASPPLLALASSTVALVALASCSSAPDPSPPATTPGATSGGASSSSSGATDAGAGDAATPPKTIPEGGSAGCGKPAAELDYVEGKSVSALGKTRTFARWVPKSYDPYKAYRVVVVLHSGGRTGASTRPYFDLEKYSGDSAIFLYPDGLDKNWDLDTQPPNNPDVAFFDALLDATKGAYCIDSTRVFVTGSSMGAYLTNQLGCWKGAATIRAIAPHAGSGPYQDKTGKYDAEGHLVCNGEPPAAMVFHGLADTNVKPEDGQFSADHWRFWNGCGASTSPIAPAPCTRFEGCKKPVQSCWIPGQGHALWADGRKATWDFFAGF